MTFDILSSNGLFIHSFFPIPNREINIFKAGVSNLYSSRKIIYKMDISF